MSLNEHVFPLRISGFEMGEYAGELPRKFISFHCLENESNVPKDCNTEESENYPDLPRRSGVEIVMIEETGTSPSKSLAVLQVAGGKKTMSEERGNVDKESFAVGSQECLLSSSDEGSEGLQKFLRDKLESLGGDGIENIAEVDPAGVLELLDSDLVNRDNTGRGMVTSDNEFPRSQVDAVLGFSRTEVNEFNDTDSLKTLGQIRSDVRKKGELYKWSREGRPNPISPSGSDGGGYVFTEEMLELAPFAKVFATGPENPLKNRHCFYCMLCRRNVSMRSRGLYELKRHFQREHHLRADQRFRARYYPSKLRGSDGRTLYGSKLEAERELFMHLDVPELDHKRPFYYDVVEGKPFTFTSVNSRTLIQIELLLIFLRGGGQLWTLEEYWTQVGVLTGHSASTADFNWSSSHISVRI